ncbi:hypothetical protein [Pelomonas sp. BJYL3]|uniref:hypothetical protein n=1 Tax=Pelomonas sp. BJYL3 TaxID=2976697 RepID=UPI0022B3FF52|nr:hypothetical protein [Pelomonas sp. BJYL3]
MGLKLFSRLWEAPDRDLERWVERGRSGNGYEREAAVHALAALRTGEAIPSLLARANDWVPEVSHAARRALTGLMSPEHVPHWLACLEQIVALQRATRVDHRALLQGLRSLLGSPDVLPMTLSASRTGSLAVRRWVFALQIDALAEQAAGQALLQDALRGKDIFTARQALRHILQWPLGPVRDGLLREALQCRFSSVRAAALRWVLASQPELLPAETLRALCFDISAAVRGVALHVIRGTAVEAAAAQAALGRWEQADLPGRARAAALLVLLTLRPEESGPWLPAALQDSSAQVRARAYASQIACTPPDQQTALALQAFKDSSGRVQRVAMDSLRRGALAPAAEDLLAVAVQHGTPGSLDRGLAMMGYCSFWSRFLCVLRALCQPGCADPVRMLAALNAWTRQGSRMALEPSPAQSKALVRLWPEAVERVPEPLLAEIRFMLASFEIRLSA